MSKLLIGNGLSPCTTLVSEDISQSKAEQIAQGIHSRGIAIIFADNDVASNQLLAVGLGIPHREFPQANKELLGGDIGLFYCKTPWYAGWRLLRHRGEHSWVTAQLTWISQLYSGIRRLK